MSAVVVLIGLVVGVLFLEETHEKKKQRRDPGLELGRWIVQKFKARSGGEGFTYSKWADANVDEATTLLEPDREPPNYDTAADSKLVHSELVIVPNVLEHDQDPEADKSASTPAKKNALTTQVMLNVVSYGILA